MLGSATLSFIINHYTYFSLPPFSHIHISQGNVVTYLRFGGVFKYQFVANLPMMNQ